MFRLKPAAAAGAALALFLTAGQAFAADRVQTATGSSSGGATVSATWPAPTSAGNLLVAVIAVRDTATVITPPAGPGWTLAVRSDDTVTSLISTAIYYVQNAASQSGASTWTVSPDTKATLTLAEYRSIATTLALDTVSGSTGTSNGGSAGQTPTTAEPVELAVAAVSGVDQLVYTFPAGGFAEVSQVGSSGGPSSSRNTTILMERYLVTRDSPWSGATIDLSTTWAGAIATFRSAPLYWTGAGAGNFGDPNRWATTSGGSTFVTPTASDWFVFDGGGTGNCSFPATASMPRIETRPGYPGTVTVSPGAVVTVTHAALFNSGTVAVAGRLLVRGRFNGAGSTFTAAGGTVVLDTVSGSGFTPPGGSFPNLVLADSGGLVGYWRLDETAGTSAGDASGFENTGTHGNGPSPSTDVPPLSFASPRSLSLDGVDDFVSLGAGPLLDVTERITVSLWFKCSAVPTQFDSPLMKTTDGSWGDGYGFYFDPTIDTVVFFAGVWTNGATATLPLAQWTQWNHIVGVYDGSNVRIWLNGVEGTPFAYAGAITSTVGPLELGRANGGGSPDIYTMAGNLDDIRVYRRALGAGEVAALAGGGQPIASAPTPVGHWRFDETAGTVAADSSGSGHNGNHVNGPTPSATVPVPPLTFPDPRSLAFDGVDDYVVVPTAPGLGITGDITIAAWVRRNLPGERSGILGKTNGSTVYDYDLVIGDDNYIYFWSDVTTPFPYINSPFQLTDTGWHHLAATRRGDTSTIYVDGVAVTTGTMTGAFNNNPLDVWIGNDWTTFGEHRGNLDDVRLYNVALGAGEIAALVAGGESPAGRSYLLAGPLAVAGDLVLSGGTLDASVSNHPISVGGSWLNHGVRFVPRSGTVTLAATALGRTVQAGGQAFFNLAASGAGGGWSQADAIQAQGAFTQSAGTYDTNGRGLTVTGNFTQSGGLHRVNGGFTRVDGSLTVAGSGSPELLLTAGGELRLGNGASISIGNGSSPGRLSASGAPRPRITTALVEGVNFYSMTAASTGTLNVTALDVFSLASSGLTLAAGATLNNGAAGAISGLVFDRIQAGGTYLRFLHTSGSFTVSGSTFANTGAPNPLNISTPSGTAPASLVVSAYLNNGGARVGPGFENDHGAGTDTAIGSSTIRWFAEGPAASQLAPLAFAVVNNNTPTFDWSDVTNAASYALQVDDDPAFGTPAISIAMAASIALPLDYSPVSLAPGFTYWRVRATDPLGQTGPWAGPIGFQVDPPPPLLSPPNGSTTKDSTPTFDWSDQGGAVDYDVQVAANLTGDFTSPIINAPNIVPSTYTAGVLAEGGYSWRVRSRDAAGNVSAWSPHWTLTVDTTLPALTSPAGGATVTGAGGVTFTWTASTGAVSYRFQLATAPTFVSPLLDITLAGTTFSSGTLSAGTYHWRVFAVDAGGFQLPTASSSFTATGANSFSVALGPNTPSASNQLNSSQDLSVLQLRFAVTGLEDVRITSITFTGFGSGGESAHLQGVRLFHDVNSDGQLSAGTDALLGGPAAYLADNGTLTFGGLNFVVPSSQSRDLILVYSFNGTAPIGSTFAARLALATHVNALGVTSGQTIIPSGTLPLDGGLVTIVSSGSPGGLTLTAGASSPPDGFIAPAEQTVEVLQVRLTASSVEAVRVTGLAVHASGTGNDLNDVATVFLSLDANGNGVFNAGVDSVIATGTYAADNGTATFALNETIPAGQSVNWLAVYDMAGSAAVGATFRAEVRPATPGDVVAVGLTSGLPIAASGATIAGALKTVGATGTNPGSVTVSNVVLPDPAPALPIGRDIPMLGFELSVGGLEGVAIQQVRIKGTGTGNEAAHVQRANLWEDSDGSGGFSGGDRLIASLSGPFSADDGEAIFAIVETLAAGAVRKWWVTYDLSGLAAGGETFQASFDLGAAPPPMTASGSSSGALLVPFGGLVIGPVLRVIPLVGSSGKDAGSTCAGSAASLPRPWGSAPVAAGAALLAFLRRRRPGLSRRR